MTDEEHRQRELELKYGFRFKILDYLGLATSQLIPWGSLAIISYFLYLSIHSLAGQHTFADIGLKFLGDFKINEALAYVLAGGAVMTELKRKSYARKTLRVSPKGRVNWRNDWIHEGAPAD